MAFEDFDDNNFKIKVDNDAVLGKFVGYSRNLTATSADSVWLIKRIFTSGVFTDIDYANVGGTFGRFNAVWDNRTSYFTAASFNNSYSIYTTGANEYISIGDKTALKFTDVTPFSVSIWFKTPGTGTYCICGKQGASNALGYRIEMVAGRVEFHLSGGASGNRIEIRSPTSVYNDNQWHNVVMVYNGDKNANNCKMIIDGTNIAFTVSANTLVSTIDTTVGYQISGRNATTNNWTGFLDENSIWNKALSVLEAQEIYDSGAATNLSAHSAVANLKGWWRCGDNATFPTIPDISGSGNNGTCINMTVGNIVSEVP